MTQTKSKRQHQQREVRLLTASEIESLRRDKQETGMWAMKEFAKMPKLLTPEELAAIEADDEEKPRD